jgi:rod shape-determining protein MreB
VRHSGLLLTGGGARLEGMERHLAAVTGYSARLAQEPEGCTVRGTALAVDNLDLLKRNFMYIR